MTRGHLIAVAVLAAGCEQLKAPKRIHELEGRLDELAQEVDDLKGGSGARKHKDRDKDKGHDKDRDRDKDKDKGRGDEHGEERAGGESHAKATEREHGEESEKESEKDAKEPERSRDKDRGRDHDDKDPARKSRDDDRDRDDDKKKPEHDERSDDPMERIKAVVAKNTGVGAHASGREPPHWSYEGKSGPKAWGALDPAWKACGEGEAQSPIDIEPRSGTASPIKFHYKPTAATVIDNGHTLQVNLAPGSSIEIEDRVYGLAQFHFHTPSEHTIAGEHYPLEVHLVHKDADGKLAVIGVLYDAGAESKPLGEVWAKWPRKTGVEDKLRKPFDPSTLLPDTRTVFRYDGSLTTPPCTEGVVWNVMRRTLTDSKQHLALFGQHYVLNAREPQPRNDRKVE